MAQAQPVWRWTASALAEAVQRRELSCREVVQAHLDRIEAVNGAVGAVTVTLAESALAQADAADAALAAGEAAGPLQGVPMTVKENVDVAGSATTQAVPALRELVPPLDAPHVAQLRRAGAIPIARTNMPDFALRWHTDNALWGPTRNPWDPSRTPGGSSGGDAAALAVGMTPLGNGNDYGGSLRVPSHFCGTCALRPTLGRIAHASSVAPSEDLITLQLFAVQGPMARSVGDLRLALDAMSGRDARDPWWTPAPRGEQPDALRVAVTADPAGLGVHPDVAAGVRRAADALTDAGYAVEEAEPPAVDEAARLWATLVFAEIRATLLPAMRPLLAPDAITFLEHGLASEPEIDLPGFQAALGTRNAHARRWAQFQERYPLVLGPVCTQPPFPVGRDVESPAAAEEIMRSLRLTTTVNLLGLPSLALPVGVANGLPQGVQLVGGRYAEDTCLAAGEAVEARLGTLTPIDPA